MLTERTKTAITLLYQISGVEVSPYIKPDSGFISEERALLKSALLSGGLIDSRGRLTRPLHSISLLHLLVVIHEGVYPLASPEEEAQLYRCSTPASRQLGIVNSMMSSLLGKINLSDL